MMRFNGRPTIAVLLLLSTTMAAKCITFNDDAGIWVNAENLSGTYNITQGATQFASPNDCETKQPGDYIDADFGTIVGGHLVDIRYQAFGAFAGNIVNGVVRVNNVQILSYSGPWATFTTERSLLTGDHLTVNQAGVTALISAIQNNQPVTLCVGGGFSTAAPAGLSVKVTVFAQLEVDPD